MNITSKHIQRSNAVFVFERNTLTFPEAAQVFALYQGSASKGALFSDNASIATRIFEFPEVGYQLIFEPDKIRLEDKKSRTPDESKLGQEILRIVNALYPQKVPVAYGFNYDILYRTQVVIPMPEIMEHFLKKEVVEDVKDFGWQYTVAKEKGKHTQTYFFKVVSPIEINMHANFHFNDYLPLRNQLIQNAFERAYKDADEGMTHTSF